ncbi:D-rhamnosyltransferase WbpZ [Ramlibacter solisilvae]|uniref:Glycosyl transferase family 1 n=1 Tax=Ramlibacter tataouinensis TaxID=94132 RepID=A0A127JUY9_9BURK|nr:glycosyltransferase [Ramlibacter tataouinensis]AMO23838.1 glycosyl transferase family 1 [Ramlibacter tataouinensis]
MRVLHVYKSYYPDTLGGIEQVINQLGKGLAALGDESRVFTLSPGAHPAVLRRPEGEVHRSRVTLEIASNPISIDAFAEFRRQLQWADVVHYQFPWPFGDLLHVLHGCDKPSVVSYQSDIVRQKWLLRAYTPLMNRFLRAATAVVATSPQYRDSSPVLARLGPQVRVIPNGIDEASYPQPSAAEVERWRGEVGEGFFLFVGVLRYYKGLETLLRAAKDLRGRIVVAGTGPEAERLRQHAERESLANVRFLGAISDEDKMCLLRLAGGFVFPSHLRSEAFGMSLVEAAMCGKPMITCEIGTGTSFINVDGVTGWVVGPDDAAALRDAMRRLLDSPALAGEMGVAARRRFEELFTATRMARSYHELYRELLPQPTSALA